MRLGDSHRGRDFASSTRYGGLRPACILSNSPIGTVVAAVHRCYPRLDSHGREGDGPTAVSHTPPGPRTAAERVAGWAWHHRAHAPLARLGPLPRSPDPRPGHRGLGAPRPRRRARGHRAAMGRARRRGILGPVYNARDLDWPGGRWRAVRI